MKPRLLHVILHFVGLSRNLFFSPRVCFFSEERYLSLLHLSVWPIRHCSTLCFSLHLKTQLSAFRPGVLAESLLVLAGLLERCYFFLERLFLVLALPAVPESGIG